MVDAERIGARLDRLEHLIERLDRVRARGERAYLESEEQRAMTERWLQLAIQACIDMGAQIVSELSVSAPSDYAAVFKALADAGVVGPELGDRLAAAARQRNVLVHLYMDIDDRAVFATLSRLDDLRAFAAAVQRLADEG
ncbi:MAG: type VII toxin-antitoxin system HepT family RNase toxin [Thermoleophilaceae bacterium]